MFKNLLKKITTALVGAAMCMTAFASLSTGLTANAASNEQQIYNFLTGNMKLNSAAACGVLANIEKESNFNPTAMEYGYTWNSGAGYGICQWTNYPRTAKSGRRTNLVNFCNKKGYNYKSLTGQLYFLKNELETSYKNTVLTPLKNVPNTAQGAYQAGYTWCYKFEVPANYKNVSVTRGNIAKNTYWPKYKKGNNGDDGKVTYFKKCNSKYTSIVDALKSIGADSSYAYRKKIAAKNNISNYSGTAAQNTKMLNLLKNGKLIKP